MTKRRDIYQGTQINAINIPSVDSKKFSVQADAFSTLQKRIASVKDFALKRGQERVESKAEEFARSSSNPLTIDAFIKPGISDEQKEKLMGNQFGNAYQRKLYETNQEILTQEYSNLGKVIIQGTYDERLASNSPIDDFYRDSSGQIDAMLEGLSSVSPILSSKIKSELYGDMYDKYLEYGTEYTKRIKEINGDNLENKINGNKPSIGPILTGQYDNIEDYKKAEGDKIRNEAANSNLSGNEIEALVETQLTNIDNRLKEYAIKVADIAYAKGDMITFAIALKTGDFSDYADPNDPYATDNLSFHMLNVLYDNLNETERVAFDKEINDHITSLKQNATILAQADKDNVTMITNRLKKFLHPTNLTANFRGPKGETYTQDEILEGNGKVTINNQEYSYTEAKVLFNETDPEAAAIYFKTSGVRTFTTPGSEDWLKNRITINAKNNYIPDSIASELYDSISANDGELIKQEWDRITGGDLGEWDTSYNGDSMFFGNVTQGNIVKHIDDTQSENFKTLQRSVANLIGDPQVIAFVNDALPREYDIDLLSTVVSNSNRYTELLESQKGELFVEIVSAVQEQISRAESNKEIISIEAITNNVIPSIVNNEFDKRTINARRKIMRGLYNGSKSKHINENNIVQIKFLGDYKKTPNVDFDIFGKDQDLYETEEKIQNVLSVFSSMQNNNLGLDRQQEVVDVIDPMQFKKDLEDYLEIVRLRIDIEVEIKR